MIVFLLIFRSIFHLFLLKWSNIFVWIKHKYLAQIYILIDLWLCPPGHITLVKILKSFIIIFCEVHVLLRLICLIECPINSFNKIFLQEARHWVLINFSSRFVIKAGTSVFSTHVPIKKLFRHCIKSVSQFNHRVNKSSSLFFYFIKWHIAKLLDFFRVYAIEL